MTEAIVTPNVETIVEPAIVPVSRELQQVWFTVASQRWSSLLVLPAPGAFGAEGIARGLVQVARRSAPEWRCELVDATGVTLEQVPELRQRVARREGSRDRLIVVTESFDRNPAALGVATACDAAVLCVGLGASDLETSRDTLARCGSLRFLGAVVVRPTDGR